MTDTVELIERYRRLLVEHSEAPHKPSLANKLFLENRAIYRTLRQG